MHPHKAEAKASHDKKIKHYADGGVAEKDQSRYGGDLYGQGVIADKGENEGSFYMKREEGTSPPAGASGSYHPKDPERSKDRVYSMDK